MRQPRGFTLIELMVVLTIISILAAIAIPSYRDHLRRGARSTAQQFLLDIAQRQEQFFLDQRCYSTLVGIVPGGLNLDFANSPASKYYQAPVIANVVCPVPAGTQPAYLVSMAPVVGSIVDGDGTMVLDNLQRKWREVDGNLVYTQGPGADCRWEEQSCKAQ
jgi:type IV pilus assembly protein PilE